MMAAALQSLGCTCSTVSGPAFLLVSIITLVLCVAASTWCMAEPSKGQLMATKIEEGLLCVLELQGQMHVCHAGNQHCASITAEYSLIRDGQGAASSASKATERHFDRLQHWQCCVGFDASFAMSVRDYVGSIPGASGCRDTAQHSCSAFVQCCLHLFWLRAQSNVNIRHCLHCCRVMLLLAIVCEASSSSWLRVSDAAAHLKHLMCMAEMLS